MRRKDCLLDTLATQINKTYYVSTAYRQSSSSICPTWYYELFVWTLDKQNQLDKLIYQGKCSIFFERAYKEHMRLVKVFTYLTERKLRNLDER